MKNGCMWRFGLGLMFFWLMPWGTISASAAVVAMRIITPAQTLPVGACSSRVVVQAQNNRSLPANVPKNTAIFFTGSSSGLRFYSDPDCKTSVSKVIMGRGSSSQGFYFQGKTPGTQTLVVATFDYIDDQQDETITASGPSPTPTVTPAPTTVPPGVRSIPAPIYGVTLDQVSDSIRPAEISTLKKFAYFPTSRIVFDERVSAAYYAVPIQELRPVTYIMGEIADSSTMSSYTVNSIRTRAQQYFQALRNGVDVWEIGNEVNGGWLGSNTAAKVQAMYDVVSAGGGVTALTFFYEGEPSDPNNCLDGPENDMFTWINTTFQLSLPSGQRSAETEKMRLGLNYAFVAWYPENCPNTVTDWPQIFSKLAAIFPNSKVGFGEIGTATPQYGSPTEINIINRYYPLAKTTILPASYVGGYFWWNFAEELNTVFDAINAAIQR